MPRRGNKNMRRINKWRENIVCDNELYIYI